MKSGVSKLQLVRLAALACVTVLAGCQLVPEIFNEDLFLSQLGTTTGSQNQVRPGDTNLLQINFRNRTDYTATINVKAHRPSGFKDMSWTIGPGTQVGQLLDNCEADPPVLVRLKYLGEDEQTSQSAPTTLTFPDSFVFVGGVPTVISSAPPPLELGTHYELGDTIEFIICPKPEDNTKFEIRAGIYGASSSKPVEVANQ